MGRRDDLSQQVSMLLARGYVSMCINYVGGVGRRTALRQSNTLSHDEKRDRPGSPWKRVVLVSTIVVALLCAFQSRTMVAQASSGTTGCFAAVTDAFSTLQYNNASGSLRFDLNFGGSAGTVTGVISGTTGSMTDTLAIGGLNGSVPGTTCPTPGTTVQYSQTAPNPAYASDLLFYNNGSNQCTIYEVDFTIGSGTGGNAAMAPGIDGFIDPSVVPAGQSLLEGLLACGPVKKVPFQYTISGETIIGFGGGLATPELGSGELLALGVCPIFGAVYLRRRRRQS